MKTLEVYYKYGHLYSRDTHKRLLLKDGVEMVLVISPGAQYETDPNFDMNEPLDPEKLKDKFDVYCAKNEIRKYWKLVEAGTRFYFEIKAGVKDNTHLKKQHLKFGVLLLEDLWLYNKREKPELARLFECRCVVDECYSTLPEFERIPAYSLNDAYTKTYELFFALYGRSTINVFRAMKLENAGGILLADLSIRKQTEKKEKKSDS